MKEAEPEGQKGFVLVVVAIVLIILVGFVALGVDTGALYSARTSAQEVADAAALAGAFTYINDPANPSPGTLATDNALQVALNNTILGRAIAWSVAPVTSLLQPRVERPAFELLLASLLGRAAP